MYDGLFVVAVAVANAGKMRKFEEEMRKFEELGGSQIPEVLRHHLSFSRLLHMAVEVAGSMLAAEAADIG